MAITAREVERKYDADADVIGTLGDLPGVRVDPEPRHDRLDATYYDTGDLRLLRAGLTLRRRTGGADAGWHLKSPAGRDAREEARVPLTDDDAGTVPAELADRVAVHARGRPLVPVARLRTRRATRRLTDDAGRTLAEVADDTVTADALTGRPVTTGWHEIEVELIEGDGSLLDTVDRALRAGGARPAATGSKLARALGDRPPVRAASRPAGEPPPAADASPAGGAASAAGRSAGPAPEGVRAGDVLLAYLRAQVAALTACDPRVRRDEPDAVHQMRVATRRARSALRECGPLLDGDRPRHLRAELQWLAGELGTFRDREVIHERLTRLLDELPADLVVGPVRDRIAGHFAHGLGEARRSALGALSDARYFTLLDDLDAVLADPPLTGRAGRPAAEVLPSLLGKAERRLARAIDGIAPEPGLGQDHAVHEARKTVKRARYVAEIAIPSLGGEARRRVARMKRLQDVLGDHQDGVVARGVLLEIAGEARENGEDTFTYGVLYEHEAHRAREIERSIRAGAARPAAEDGPPARAPGTNGS